MAVTYPDLKALPAAQLVFDCLRDAAEQNPKPPAQISFRLGVTGEPLTGTMDSECCDGLAFVRVSRAYPSAGAPNPMAGSIRCALPWALEIELGIWRCVPWGSAARPPTPDEWGQANTDMLNDFATIRDALCCVLSARDPGSVVIGEWAPKSDPESGCFGTSVTIQMDLFGRGT